MKFFLVRHGETEWNKLGRFQGHTDISLNEALAGKSASIAVPVMRSVFVSEDAERVRQAREALVRQAAAIARAPLGAIRLAVDEDVEAWALVGSPAQVRERIDHYREKLGVTHLIARAHVPGLAPEAIEDSLSAFASLRD